MVQAVRSAIWRSGQALQVANDLLWDEPAPIGNAIMSVGRLVRARLRAMVRAETDLHEQEMLVLLELEARGPVTRSELASLLHIDRAASGRSVKTLERLGLVAGHAARGPMSFTAAGLDVSGRLMEVLVRFEQDALHGISATRIRTARRALHAVRLVSMQAIEGGVAASAVREASPWKSNGAHDLLIKELMLTARVISSIAAARITDNCQFSPFKARLLMQIAERPASARTLARILDCDKGQLSRMLATLGEEGLVRLAKGRRNGLLCPTAAGRKAYARVAAEMAVQDCGYHAVLDARAPAILTQALGEIASNVRAAPAALSL